MRQGGGLCECAEANRQELRGLPHVSEVSPSASYPRSHAWVVRGPSGLCVECLDNPGFLWGGLPLCVMCLPGALALAARGGGTLVPLPAAAPPEGDAPGCESAWPGQVARASRARLARCRAARPPSRVRVCVCVRVLGVGRVPACLHACVRACLHACVYDAHETLGTLNNNTLQATEWGQWADGSDGGGTE